MKGESDKRPLCFIPWRQIERYIWEADMLTVAGTQSVLSGGPVEGGTVRISSSDRPRVEQILAHRARRGIVPSP